MRHLLLPALLGSLACMPTAFGITIQPASPPRQEPPVPEPFGGEAEPTLEPGPLKGLFQAPGVHPHLYYYAPDDLWYRYWKGGWYQAFLWNGAWYPPRRVPEALHAVQPPPEGLESE